MPLPRSRAWPLSRTRLEANPPNRAHPSFHAARKVRRRVAESAAQSGSGWSARRTLVRVSVAFSRSRLDGDLLFFPVVQSAVPICRLWCVSLPCLQLDTNLDTKARLYRRRRSCGGCGNGKPSDPRVGMAWTLARYVRRGRRGGQSDRADTKSRRATRLTTRLTWVTGNQRHAWRGLRKLIGLQFPDGI